MSGILALYAHRQSADHGSGDRRFLERATDLLKARAPDGVDHLSSGPVHMIETRLDTGHPAEPADQGVIQWRGLMTVADVRLDCRRELSIRLERAGVSLPRGACDGQWVAAAWSALGSECPAYLHGDFSFVVWDPSSRMLAAARDHFGVRPLYFAELSSGVVVSNSLAPILAHPEVGVEKDPVGVLDYLLFDSNFEPDGTIWRGIRRVPPGHVVIWQGDGLRKGGTRRSVRFHEPWKSLSSEPMDPEERIEDFRAALRDAVRARAREGESIAISMSGGLDSTSLAAMACDLELRPRAYTLFYERAIEDREGELAAQTAEFLGIPHRRRSMDAYALFDRWQELPWSPMPGDPMVDAIYHDFDLDVLESSKVVLTGWGGDPLLLPERGLWCRRLAGGHWGAAVLDIWRSLLAVGKLPPMGLWSSWEMHRARRHWRQGFPRWLDPDFARGLDAEDRWRRQSPAFRDGAELAVEARKAGKGGPDRRLRRPEALRYTFDLQWSHVFERVDAGNRGLPLERRHPFFDHRVVDRALSAPTSPWCIDKHLLRKAMAGRLPVVVLKRPKSPQVGDPKHPEGRPLRELLETWLHMEPEIRCYIRTDVLLEELERQAPAGGGHQGGRHQSGGRRNRWSVSAAWRRPLNFAAWAARAGDELS